MDELKTISGRTAKINATLALEPGVYYDAAARARARGVTLAAILKDAIARGLACDQTAQAEKVSDR